MVQGKFESALSQLVALQHEFEHTAWRPNGKGSSMYQLKYNIATCFHWLHRFHESEANYREVLELVDHECQEGAWSCDYALSRRAFVTGDMGQLFSLMGDDARAMSAFESSLSMYDSLIETGYERGSENHKVENMLVARANVACKIGEHLNKNHHWHEASTYFHQCSYVYAKQCGTNHLTTATTCVDLAGSLLHSAILSMRTRIPDVSEVQIGGLVNTPSLNGCHGIVFGFDGDSGRYIVRIHGQHAFKQLKAVNIVRARGDPSRATTTPYSRLEIVLQKLCLALPVFSDRSSRVIRIVECFFA